MIAAARKGARCTSLCISCRHYDGDEYDMELPTGRVYCRRVRPMTNMRELLGDQKPEMVCRYYSRKVANETWTQNIGQPE